MGLDEESRSLTALGTWARRLGLRPHSGPHLSPQDVALSAVLAVCSSAGDALEVRQQAELVEAGCQLWASLHSHLVRRPAVVSLGTDTVSDKGTGTEPALPSGKGLVSSVQVQLVMVLVGTCSWFSSKWLHWVSEAVAVQPPVCMTSWTRSLPVSLLLESLYLLGLQVEGVGGRVWPVCILSTQRQSWGRARIGVTGALQATAV